MTLGLLYTLVATAVTFFIVGVFMTVMVTVARKNYVLERALKASAAWQRRARRAEENLRRLRDDGGDEGRAA